MNNFPDDERVKDDMINILRAKTNTGELKWADVGSSTYDAYRAEDKDGNKYEVMYFKEPVNDQKKPYTVVRMSSRTGGELARVHHVHILYDHVKRYVKEEAARIEDRKELASVKIIYKALLGDEDHKRQ